MNQLLCNSQKLSHFLLKTVVKPHDYVIDATMGNGFDTVFLAQLVGEKGKVFAFDIQETALSATFKRLKEHNLDNRCELFLLGHEKIQQVISHKISAVIFNLGYLPNSDKTIVTSGLTTVQAIQGALPLLKLNGIIILVVYLGHQGSFQEHEMILNFVKTLNQKYFTVAQYQLLNQKNTPAELIVIEKIKELNDENFNTQC